MSPTFVLNWMLLLGVLTTAFSVGCREKLKPVTTFPTDLKPFEMEYSNYYRNQEWLYTVYLSEDSKVFILVAIVPGVGWSEIAMRLEPGEIETLIRSKDEFTDLVNRFLHGRELPQFKNRRIESQIKQLEGDKIKWLGTDVKQP